MRLRAQLQLHSVLTSFNAHAVSVAVFDQMHFMQSLHAIVHGLYASCAVAFDSGPVVQDDVLSGALAEAAAKRGKGIFKRHKAKGPNPLAMKKKSKKSAAGSAATGQQEQRKKRARKRGNKGASGDGDAGE